MNPPSRGEIWDIKFNSHGKNDALPFLILSDESLNSSMAHLVVAIPVLYSDLKICSHVQCNISQQDTIITAYVCCDQLLTFSRDRCVKYTGHIHPQNMEDVSQTIKLILGL